MIINNYYLHVVDDHLYQGQIHTKSVIMPVIPQFMPQSDRFPESSQQQVAATGRRWRALAAEDYSLSALIFDYSVEKEHLQG